MVGFFMQAGDTSETTLAAEGRVGPPPAMRVVFGMLPMGIFDLDKTFSQLLYIDLSAE